MYVEGKSPFCAGVK